MLRSIELEGFKDQNRALELGRRNLLVGRNGLGKSAFIEGLIYALSGRVPGGKAKDEVAKCFAPRGGLVRVVDEEGRWIARGITVDHKDARVSEVLELEPEDAPAIWECNPALLQFRYFEDLSASKRREFMLELVGAAGGKLSRDRGRELLLLGFAKEIGGDGADESCILETSKLPEQLRPIAAEWSSLWGYVESFDWPDTDASDALTKILGVAKERKNEARAAAKKSKASLDELTVEAKGATIAAEEYADAKAKKDAAARAHAVAEAVADEIDRSKSRLDVARKAAADLTAEWKAKKAKLEERPNVPPPEGEDPASVDREEQRLDSKVDEMRRLERDQSEHKERMASRDRQAEILERLRRELAEHQNQPMGHLIDALRAYEGFAPESGEGSAEFADLRSCCEELAAGWRAERKDKSARVDAETAKLESMDRLIADARPPQETDLARVRQEVGILKSNVERVRRLNDAWYANLRAVHREEQERRELREELARIEERLAAARQAAADELARLDGHGTRPDVSEAARALQEAAAELERLQRVRGAADAYAAAKDRAERSQANERAWTAFERAAADARETYVASLAEPLRADIGAFLAAVGREERAYLELENARGRPVFDLGWTLGDSRRSLNALSHGEATIYGAGVAVAVARRARGRKLILVEADRVDVESLEPLLEGLGSLDDAFDAVMVSTHHRDVRPPTGWRVHSFNAEGDAVKSHDLPGAAAPGWNPATEGGVRDADAP